MSEGLICETSVITIRDMLREVRDNIDMACDNLKIVACLSPTYEYEFLDKQRNKLTDILKILREKGGV